MLSGTESISHYNRSNVTIWMVLAFQAGMLNIGGFMACHRFVSHVTGFATFFGLEASRGSLEAALGMLLVPALFLGGAMISGYLVDLRLKLHLKPRYYIVFGILFFLLLIVFAGGEAGLFGHFGESVELTRDYSLLCFLCLICGLQNGTVTTVSRNVVRTTHLTGITTDLGIGVVRVLNRRRLGTAVDEDVRANLMRAGIISFFIMGSVAGGFIFAAVGFWGFSLPMTISGILCAVMILFQRNRN